MKIKIIDKSKVFFNLWVPIPLCAIKWKILYKKEEMKAFFPIANEIYSALKSYVKRNRHFVLVEVLDKTGTTVKIII